MSAALPAVRIDSAFRILHVNEAAALCGVQIGETLLTPASAPSEAFRLWHEACLRGAADSPLDPLPETTPHIRLRLNAFHGFRLADIVYTYSLDRSYATAVLYRSHKQFFRLASALTGHDDDYARHTDEYLARLRAECVSLLAGDTYARQSTAKDLEELLSAVLFVSRIHTSTINSKRLFRLSFLLNTYLSEVLPQLRPIDCQIVCTPPDDGDISLPTDITAMFLLWTVLLRLLNDIGDDRCIRIAWNRYGEDGEIRFSAHTHRLAALPTHIPSISVLAAHLPFLELPLHTADYLSGCLDCYLDLHPDPAAGEITFSLYIPEEKQIPDFKSPGESAELLKEAIRCLRGMSRLTENDATAPPKAKAE